MTVAGTPLCRYSPRMMSSATMLLIASLTSLAILLAGLLLRLAR